MLMVLGQCFVSQPHSTIGDYGDGGGIGGGGLIMIMLGGVL